MTDDEVNQLVAHKSYVKFAGAKYEVSGMRVFAGEWFIGIFDEPPSRHVDFIKATDCEFIALTPPDLGKEK